MRLTILLAALLLSASVALAQQAPDPRLAGPQIQALQAMLTLREAEMRALSEDAQKQAQSWKDSFAAWCGDRPACGLAPPEKPAE